MKTTDQKLSHLFSLMDQAQRQERKEQQDAHIRKLTKKRRLWWQND